jgi:hypothetical protein
MVMHRPRHPDPWEWSVEGHHRQHVAAHAASSIGASPAMATNARHAVVRINRGARKLGLTCENAELTGSR